MMPNNCAQRSRFKTTWTLFSLFKILSDSDKTFSHLTCKAFPFFTFHRLGNRAWKIITLFITQIWSRTNKLCKCLSCWTSEKIRRIIRLNFSLLCMFYGFIFCTSGKRLSSQLSNCDRATLFVFAINITLSSWLQRAFEVNAASSTYFCSTSAFSFTLRFDVLSSRDTLSFKYILCIMHDLHKIIAICKCW